MIFFFWNTVKPKHNCLMISDVKKVKFLIKDGSSDSYAKKKKKEWFSTRTM